MLEIKKLNANYCTEEGTVMALRDVDLSVVKGEVVALVGESGCGKSTLALSVLKLIDVPGTMTGRIEFKGSDIFGMDERELRSVRGKSISMIFQDPFSSLNPVLSVGDQIMETLILHERLDRKSAAKRAAQLLERVKMRDPDACLRKYPHNLSGGMKQRVMIAMAIASKPDLLIADEPATALDVITGREIMELIMDLRRDLGMAVIMITHNIALASQYSDRIYVMYAGQVMESGGRDEIIKASRNPYTYMLLRCLPAMGRKGRQLTAINGRPPDNMALVPGCSFSPRCAFAQRTCSEKQPDLTGISGTHSSRCLRLKEIDFNG